MNIHFYLMFSLFKKQNNEQQNRMIISPKHCRKGECGKDNYILRMTGWLPVKIVVVTVKIYTSEILKSIEDQLTVTVPV